MGPAMDGSRAPNGQSQQYYHDVRTTIAAAMAGLPGGSAGTPSPGLPPFNPGHGQPFPNTQDNHPAQSLQSSSGGTQVNTTPSTPSATSSSVTAPSPSTLVNGISTINPGTQSTPALPEVPASFFSTEFMQSVASTLDDFDPQGLLNHEDTSIDFEQDFGQWFRDDLETR